MRSATRPGPGYEARGGNGLHDRIDDDHSPIVSIASTVPRTPGRLRTRLRRAVLYLGPIMGLACGRAGYSDLRSAVPRIFRTFGSDRRGVL
jgi:hypothetical protein